MRSHNYDGVYAAVACQAEVAPRGVPAMTGRPESNMLKILSKIAFRKFPKFSLIMLFSVSIMLLGWQHFLRNILISE